MTRISISEDEAWPSYFVGDKRDGDIPEWQGKYDAILDVDDQTLARWKAVENAYEAVQVEMADMYKTHEPRRGQP